MTLFTSIISPSGSYKLTFVTKQYLYLENNYSLLSRKKKNTSSHSKNWNYKENFNKEECSWSQFKRFLPRNDIPLALFCNERVASQQRLLSNSYENLMDDNLFPLSRLEWNLKFPSRQASKQPASQSELSTRKSKLSSSFEASSTHLDTHPQHCLLASQPASDRSSNKLPHASLRRTNAELNF